MNFVKQLFLSDIRDTPFRDICETTIPIAIAYNKRSPINTFAIPIDLIILHASNHANS